MKQIGGFLLFCVFTSLWLLFSAIPARAQTLVNPSLSDTFGDALQPLSAGWNDEVFTNGSTISAYTNTQGSFGWGIGYDQNDPKVVTYVNTLKNATYTLQLYKGDIGSSTLVYSETIPNGFATSTSEFRFSFPTAGQYVLTYTATYPDGTYPDGYIDSCHGDFCFLPKYSLQDFETFMTVGQSVEHGKYQNFIPAFLGINEFTVHALGPKSSNVLFIPGTMESRLYTRDGNDNEKLLWEPTSNSEVPELAMNSDGTSQRLIYTRDVIDYLYSETPLLAAVVQGISKDSSTMYGPFEKFMDGLVTNGTIRTWQSYPYDWRYEVSDIVSNGTLIATRNGDPYKVYLQDVVQQLASSSPTGQVTIIAHSNGGLLAKALAVQLQKENKLQLLDRIILVGSPQLGTPSAIGNILHGDGQTRVLGLVTYADTVRTTALTMPGPYDLLPSEYYFSIASAPVLSFAKNLSDTYGKIYTSSIRSYDSFVKFLTNDPAIHSLPAIGDVNTPAVLSLDLISKAKATHDILDTWVAPDSLSIDAIAGTFQLTPQGYSYSNKLLSLSHTPVLQVSAMRWY